MFFSNAMFAKFHAAATAAIQQQATSCNRMMWLKKSL
jgi:hypothetical protein